VNASAMVTPAASLSPAATLVPPVPAAAMPSPGS
jgi:hypothetical protein